jgi:glycosyltransferase involved in cell wall biosynthesis
MNEQKPLRILIVLNFEWNARLGVVRVYHELAEQWRAAGHQVERFSLSEAFGTGHGSGVGLAIRQILFAYKAAAFVRKNADRFDIIDAHIGSLPTPKGRLRFQGLLVARSVGLYPLYDRFEASARDRWPHRSRGRLLGRIFYRFVRDWFLRATDQSVKYADLVNLPNENEAEYLRREISPGLRIIVQPYGLTAERRHDLLVNAAPVATRLAGKTISFIGMWAARKGAYDWSDIIARIRERIPTARFRLLGTMVNPSVVAAELKTVSPDALEVVSEYAPDALPKLLSDCTVGIFPSYVEGFGLAVLEQLAAGIPTVTFDVAGPHDVLVAQEGELLVPPGDVDALANAVCKILELDLEDYEKLSQRSVAIAAGFDWSSIADKTIRLYRERLNQINQSPVCFVQPFGLGSPGGGARILRALLANSPVPAVIVCTSPERPQLAGDDYPVQQIHLPIRPYFGRIERTRFGFLAALTAPLFEKQFVRRLKQLCRDRHVAAIHTIPHTGLDFYDAYGIATELRLPFHLQIHDDFLFSSQNLISEAEANEAMRTAWRGAQSRFVISKRLGEEYCRRYGAQDYTIITDGLDEIASSPAQRVPNEFRIYFMGLFHLEYEDNLLALLKALQQFRDHYPSVRVSVTLRCQALRPKLLRVARDMVRVLPFASESTVQKDIERADLLYLPLPFDEAFKPFVKWSLSTKMVTYVGSGVPILYHGPSDSHAYELLFENAAAFFCLDRSERRLGDKLCEIYDHPQSAAAISGHALQLARNQFMARDQRAKFWNAILQAPLCAKTRPDPAQPVACSA